MHPEPEELLQAALDELVDELAAPIRAHVLICEQCRRIGTRLVQKHHAMMREALIFSKLIGRLVSPFEIMSGRRHN